MPISCALYGIGRLYIHKIRLASTLKSINIVSRNTNGPNVKLHANSYNKKREEK